MRRLEDLAWPQLGTGYEPQLAFDDRWEFYARGDAEGNVSVRRLADDQEVARFTTAAIWQPSGIGPILRCLLSTWYGTGGKTNECCGKRGS